MNHASLFSGIGGFDIAAEWCGWNNVFHCEYDSFCQQVLKYHFPNSKLYTDVRTFDATNYIGTIDILSGGFPCQPFSAAGKRKGTEDERHLWPEMLRIIREVRPTYVVGENVRGLLNWSGGLVFEEVCSDLEAEGYDVTPYILPACAVNAPHRRGRIWFIAYSTRCANLRRATKNEREGKKERIQKRDAIRQSIKSSDILKTTPNANSKRRREGGKCQHNDFRKWEVYSNEQNNGNKIRSDLRNGSSDGTTPNADSIGQKRGAGRNKTKKGSQPRNEQISGCHELQIPNFEMFPSQPPLCGGDDGLPKELDSITFPKWRNESIKAYGNAIVPQVAYQIFQTINEIETKQIEAGILQANSRELEGFGRTPYHKLRKLA